MMPAGAANLRSRPPSSWPSSNFDARSVKNWARSERIGILPDGDAVRGSSAASLANWRDVRHWLRRPPNVPWGLGEAEPKREREPAAR